MISTKQVLRIHQLLIDQFGGSSGIRDKVYWNQLLIDRTKPLMVTVYTLNLLIRLLLFWKVSLRTTLLLMEIKEPVMY